MSAVCILFMSCWCTRGWTSDEWLTQREASQCLFQPCSSYLLAESTNDNLLDRIVNDRRSNRGEWTRANIRSSFDQNQGHLPLPSTDPPYRSTGHRGTVGPRRWCSEMESLWSTWIRRWKSTRESICWACLRRRFIDHKHKRFCSPLLNQNENIRLDLRGLPRELRQNGGGGSRNSSANLGWITRDVHYSHQLICGRFSETESISIIGRYV